ncbi:hypothetical protein HZD78_21480 [Mycobacteroides chelonae]|uniref:hypothetical protein n=1 Tax=Mycobacteroides chelonae TaxID=1774 RepID=UPI001C4787AD|nr:hypothetical protein [Mycobacteroides chelonae]MBV6362526.1 hypothetical protein [Mycobacteroides chelonae]
MSPFTPAASSLSDLSARFQDIATALASPTPGQGRTVDAVDERNSARTITLNRLADWSYTASATAREQADIDAGLERAPSPADISALAATCHATAGNDLSALAAYQEAGAERMAAKKAHAAATSATTWPEPASPAPMPTCSVDDRPIGDGYDGEGVADPAQPESDPETPVSMTEPETAPPVTMSTDAPAASATMSTISDTAAGTSLTSDTPSTDAASRTASLSSPTATAAQAPTAGQPSPTVTGPTGGAASQLGAPQNGVRQGASGRRPAQTRNEDSQPTARDTTFDAAIAGTSGTALGVVGGAHSVSGSSAGQPSTSGAPATAPAAPNTPPSAPSGGQGAGPMGGGPMARAMGSGNTVAPTSATPPPTIVAAEIDPSIDPLKAAPDDLDWTPPTIPAEEKK